MPTPAPEPVPTPAPGARPAARAVRLVRPRNAVLLGDCVEVLARLPAGVADLVVTDPPYLCRYRAQDGRTVANDDNDRWLRPASFAMHRALKDGGLCLSFYGWTRADRFIAAWRAAGFRLVGHVVFRKRYASAERFLRYEHEQAYLLAKGEPERPARPIGDVIDWPARTGNRLHPTQKPVAVLRPLVEAFSRPGELVLDPFAGSGSTLVAARAAGRDFLGIELDPGHHATAARRLAAAAPNAAPRAAA